MGLLQNHLKLRMVVYLLLLSVIVMGLAAIAYFRSADNLREAEFKQLRVVADDRENQINQFVEDQRDNIIRIAKTPAIRDATDQLLSREIGTGEYNTSYATLDRLLRSSIETFVLALKLCRSPNVWPTSCITADLSP